MRWFKHDSDAHMDAKMRRLIHKWGIEGYGLYWYCLELIAKDVGTTNLTFELEHDAEILAHDMRMSREKVEDMMRYMIDLKLFEGSEGRITCMKLFNRIDLSQGGTKAFRDAVLAKRKEVKNGLSHDAVMTESCIDIEVDIDLEDRNKTKEIGTKRKRFIPPTVEEVAARCLELGYTVNPERFIAHYSANGWKVGRNPMKCWKSALTGWQTRENEKTQPLTTAQPKETAAQRMRRRVAEMEANAERVIP